MNKKILVIDNNLMPQCWGSKDILDSISTHARKPICVFRGPQDDIPKDLAPYSHLILSGSLTSILKDTPWIRSEMDLVKRAADLELPLLGICFGHQIIAKSLFGTKSVGLSKTPEFGWIKVKKIGESLLLNSLPSEFYSYSSHFDAVHEVDSGFQITAQSDICDIQAFESDNKKIMGIQFHPERTLEEALSAEVSHIRKSPKIPFFNANKAKNLYRKEIADKIFGNFL